ncbi:hypothetical protein FHT21_002994 [Pedobacter sp. SG908]|nr:hypothetical protein [Pedobacter sp. SG908]NMN37823.1 hypothetical protein [Pedobacter sp. SG918]
MRTDKHGCLLVRIFLFVKQRSCDPGVGRTVIVLEYLQLYLKRSFDKLRMTND